MHFVYEKLQGPWRITFDTNPYLCNLNCIMCEVHSIYNKNLEEIKRKSKNIMDFRIIEKVIKEAAQFGLREIIPSTMGEPLLYPEFEKIINLVSKYNIKLNLTTNGTFPRKGVEYWGSLILPVASDTKISINAASKKLAEEIMRNLNFELQLKNIKKYIEIRDEIRKSKLNNPTVTFQVTFMERNLEELPELLKLAIDLNVDRLKGHHLWITWNELKEESLKRNRESRNRWNNMVDKLNQIANKKRLKNGKKIKLDNIYKLPLDSKNVIPDSWICPFLGREAWIDFHGKFNVCCAPDNLRSKLGYFGNVNENSFMDLWNSKNYTALLQNWGDNPVCRNCNMRRPIEDIKIPLL